MRAMLAVPLVMLLIVGGAWAIYMVGGWRLPVREMLVAGGTCLISSELALIPLLMSRHSSQMAVMQSGLVGTTVQLLVGVVLAAVVILGQYPLGSSFIYWLMALYWVTLAIVVLVYVRAVKAAPAGSSVIKS